MPVKSTRRVACDGCHNAKSRCVTDAARLTCQRCSRLKLECKYSPHLRMGRPRKQIVGSTRETLPSKTRDTETAGDGHKDGRQQLSDCFVSQAYQRAQHDSDGLDAPSNLPFSLITGFDFDNGSGRPTTSCGGVSEEQSVASPDCAELTWSRGFQARSSDISNYQFSVCGATEAPIAVSSDSAVILPFDQTLLNDSLESHILNEDDISSRRLLQGSADPCMYGGLQMDEASYPAHEKTVWDSSTPDSILKSGKMHANPRHAQETHPTNRDFFGDTEHVLLRLQLDLLELSSKQFALRSQERDPRQHNVFCCMDKILAATTTLFDVLQRLLDHAQQEIKHQAKSSRSLRTSTGQKFHKATVEDSGIAECVATEEHNKRFLHVEPVSAREGVHAPTIMLAIACYVRLVTAYEPLVVSLAAMLEVYDPSSDTSHDQHLMANSVRRPKPYNQTMLPTLTIGKFTLADSPVMNTKLIVDTILRLLKQIRECMEGLGALQQNEKGLYCETFPLTYCNRAERVSQTFRNIPMSMLGDSALKEALRMESRLMSLLQECASNG